MNWEAIGILPVSYTFFPGGGATIPFPSVGEFVGDNAGTSAGEIVKALRDGANNEGPLSPVLDFLEEHGGPFSAGFVRAFRRSLGRPPKTPPANWYSPCNHLWEASFPYRNQLEPGEGANEVRTWQIRSAGSVSVRVDESGYAASGLNCDGSPFDAFQPHGPFNEWQTQYGQPSLRFVALEGSCLGGPCVPPDSNNPIAPFAPSPIVPVPPSFVPPSLPIPSPTGGPIVVVPVVPVIPVFVDVDLNADLDLFVDLRPTISFGPFNVQIGPNSLDINVGLPGRDAPRLPPGQPRPPTDPSHPPTKPPSPRPPAGGDVCCEEWGEKRIRDAIASLQAIKYCACRERKDGWVKSSPAGSSFALALPRGRDVVVRVATTFSPSNKNTQWGGGVAPDVVYAGWYSFSPNGAGDRKPIHYLTQEIFLGDVVKPGVFTATLYDGFEGIVTATGFDF